MISIVIPLYNHASFIEEALLSLIAQTYSDLEMIVVDDGSTDDSLAIARATLARHESRFSRVTTVTQANRGVSATLNRGIGLAEGEFVFLLASDDVAKPTAIETFHQRMITNDSIALVCGDLDLIDESGAPTTVVNNGQSFTSWIQFVTSHRNDIDLVHRFGSYETIIGGNYLTVGILLRRQCVLDVGGYDEACPIEDYDLWLKLARNYRFEFVDRQLISYRQHPNGTVVRNRTRILFDELDLLMREFDECVRRGLTDLWRRRVTQLLAAIRYVTLSPPPPANQMSPDPVPPEPTPRASPLRRLLGRFGVG